jgi:hypothetical protein
MKKLISLLLVVILICSTAVAAGAEEFPWDVTLTEPGSYTAIDGQRFTWTAPENGTYTFTIDSPDNWSYWGYAGGYGMVWAEYGLEEFDSPSFTTYLEAYSKVSLIFSCLDSNQGDGTIDFTFTFEPDGTGDGGYVYESTHQVSGDGSWEDPYVYDSVEDLLADWTNRKMYEASQLYITAPLGGTTLTVNSRYTTADWGDSTAYCDFQVQIHYITAKGNPSYFSTPIFEVWSDNPVTTFTFDAAGFERILAGCGSWIQDCTIVDDPWSDGDMVTLCYFGPASSPYSMVVDFVVEGYTPPAQPDDEPIQGDLNGDGELNAEDTYLMLLCYNEKKELDEAQLAAADVNNDGRVDLADAYTVLLKNR